MLYNKKLVIKKTSTKHSSNNCHLKLSFDNKLPLNKVRVYIKHSSSFPDCKFIVAFPFTLRVTGADVSFYISHLVFSQKAQELNGLEQTLKARANFNLKCQTGSKHQVSCSSAPASPVPRARGSGPEESLLWDLGQKKDTLTNANTSVLQTSCKADMQISGWKSVGSASPAWGSLGGRLLSLAAGNPECPLSSGRVGKSSIK